MTTLLTPTGSAAPSAFAGTMTRLADEAAALAKAFLDPATLVEEVEQMHALQVEANRIQASDPARASALLERASHIGLGPCALTRGDTTDPA